MLEYNQSNKYYRYLVFLVGIIATIAYRIIIILNYYSSFWVEVSWYIGTIGFIWYFAHRYRVQNHYSEIIKERKLKDKLCKNKLNKDDCQALSHIINSLDSSKAKWNSILIFIFSILALGYAIVAEIISWI